MSSWSQTVSAIYGLGTPQEYVDRMVRLRVGDEVDRDSMLRRLVQIQYARNDLSFTRGTFRVQGDTVEVFPMYEEHPVRIEFFGDEVRTADDAAPVTGEISLRTRSSTYSPATHYVAGPERMNRAIGVLNRNCRNGSPNSSRAIISWRHSVCGCAPSTTWR